MNNDTEKLTESLNLSRNGESRTVETADNLWWIIGTVGITLVAVFFRFWNLTLKPMHHDEGVNGYFLTTLFRDGIYRYDPSNYHGPTLYYIALFFTKLFGLETFSVRASVAVFGVLIVIMTFFLRKYLGTIGSLCAAAMLALSPGMVYISRYFIHEIFFVFCSFGIVLGILFFIEGRKAGVWAIAAMTLLLLVCFAAPVMYLPTLMAGENLTLIWILRILFFAVEAFLVFLIMRALLDWNGGRPIYLLLASASTALFFATKETAFITLGTMAIACLCIWIWRKIYVKDLEPKAGEPVQITWNLFKERVRASNPTILYLLTAAIFIYVGALFFSSFFSYSEGIIGAFKAYAIWTKTGNTDHTQNGFWAYAKWMTRIESPILFLSAVGTLIAFLKGRDVFAMFAGLWAFGLFAAYTIIPYKTPWLALSFILPMCLAAGYGINELIASRQTLCRIFGILLLTGSFGVLGYQSYDLNFVNYDDNDKPYIYAHTTRGFLDLVAKIEYYADKSGLGKESTIQIVSPDYWALPWYTRDYKHANYHGKIVPSSTAEMIIAKKDDQDEEVREEYAARYKKAGEFPLRPGVTLILLVRNDLADKDAESLYPEIEDIPIIEVSPDDSAAEK